jgi:hypothetical protein
MDDKRDIPPENGKRAWIDSATGAVHGSGVGAGGGSEGEDYDSDSAAGDGAVPLPGSPGKGTKPVAKV